MQTTPQEAYYGTYVYDIGDDILHDALKMLREWKGTKRMDRHNCPRMIQCWILLELQSLVER